MKAKYQSFVMKYKTKNNKKKHNKMQVYQLVDDKYPNLVAKKKRVNANESNGFRVHRLFVEKLKHNLNVSNSNDNGNENDNENDNEKSENNNAETNAQSLKRLKEMEQQKEHFKNEYSWVEELETAIGKKIFSFFVCVRVLLLKKRI